MTAIAARYRAVAAAFERKVAAVRADQWSNPSPCDGWSALDVVRHVIDMHGVMLAPLGRRPGPAPSADTDPLAAFRAARADIEAVLAEPALAGLELETPAGRMTGERHIDVALSGDLVLHGWDLARATGQDETIDAAEIGRVRAVIESIPAGVLRRPGRFGMPVDVPDGASEQDRLLALTGRDPR